jgi:hypothetical protein
MEERVSGKKGKEREEERREGGREGVKRKGRVVGDNCRLLRKGEGRVN